MKGLILSTIAAGLVACSSPVQQSSVPMDMQTVQEYQTRIASAKNNAQSAIRQGQHWDLDKNDRTKKILMLQQPHIHYGYAWGRHHRHYSGISLGL